MTFRTWMKTVFRRPFTLAELRMAAAQMVADPPIPVEWKEFATTPIGAQGHTVIDMWRSQFDLELVEVAAAPTWDGQRATLLRNILANGTWVTTQAVAKEAKFTESWAHLVANIPAFHRAPIADHALRTSLLAQKWFISLVKWGVLRVIGENLFTLNEDKWIELRIYDLYEKEVLELDVLMLDRIQLVNEQGEAASADVLSEFKDSVVNPLVVRQHALLARMAEEIATGQLDGDAATRDMAAMAAEREILDIRLKASTTPTVDAHPIVVTLDTDVFPLGESLRALISDAGIDVRVSSVSVREHPTDAETAAQARTIETAVWGESVFDGSVFGGPDDAACFERVLNVVSNGSFPAVGRRERMSDGAKHQLRDAMIFSGHVRSGANIFVTNDAKGFIDHGRRELLQKEFNTRIMKKVEFQKFLEERGVDPPS